MHLRISILAAAIFTASPVLAQRPAVLTVPVEDRQATGNSASRDACPDDAPPTMPACLRPDPPRYAVGDSVPEGVEFNAFFRGVDLPRLTDLRRYWRTDEYIYVVDTENRRVLEIITIADVILY